MRLCEYMKHKKEMFNASLKKTTISQLIYHTEPKQKKI